MDPLSVAASAAGLAVFVLKLSQKVAGYIRQVKAADEALGRFKNDLATLGNTLESIEESLKKIGLVNSFQKATSEDEMDRHLESLEAILSECKRTLEEYSKLLDQIPSNRFTGSWRKFSMNWKLNSKTTDLERIQSQVRSYYDALLIHLQLLLLITSSETSRGIRNIDSSLEKIKDSIMRLRLQFQPGNDEGNISLDGETLTGNAIKQSLSTSETILSSASEYFGSTAGTLRLGNTSPVNFSAKRAAQVQEWIGQRQDDEDAVRPLSDGDDSDTEMISDLANTANKHYEKGDYSKAQRFYTTFLEKISSQSSWDREQICQAHLRLAACLTARENYKEALVVLESIDNPGCPEDQKSQTKQYLAEVLCLTSEYAKAKLHAKAALRGREKGSASYYDATTLLAIICKTLGQSEEAEVYQTRVPEGFTPTRIAGWRLLDQFIDQTPDLAIDASAVRLARLNVIIATRSKFQSQYPNMIDPKEEEIASARTSTATNLTFVNLCRMRRISVYWIDWEGNLRHYVDITPGQRSIRPTYIDHAWRVIDLDTKDLIASFIAKPSDSTAIITDDLNSISHPIRGTRLLEALERETPSGPAQILTSITFQNLTGRELSILWIDRDGQAKHRLDLQAQQSNQLQTFAGYVYRVVVSNTEFRVASFAVNSVDSTATITPTMQPTKIS